MIKLALADDHTLLRKVLADWLKENDFTIVAEAENGKDLIEKIQSKTVDVVLMDIAMPEMNGEETTAWLRQNMPEVRVLALSMFNDERHVIRMIRAGARGYVLKDSEPRVLRRAILDVAEKGYHYSDLVTGSLIHSAQVDEQSKESGEDVSLTDRELEFLRLACTEMTYKEIADKMIVATRSIDNYRDALFEKLNVKSRVGLVIYAIRTKVMVIQ
ncbi:MAG: response regulator transcription factor [Flavobacteriales bacterium]|nr:response regulator transcription factor [Flavobacteriales bacterium]